MSANYNKTKIGNHALSPESLMMGYGYDPQLSEGSIKCPNFQTSTFVFKSAEDGENFFNIVSGRKQLNEGETAGLVYSRFNNPNIEIAENRIAIWDGAEDCTITGSGMSAISSMLLALAKPGDVIVYSEPIYGGTDTLLNGLLKQLGMIPVGFMSSEGTSAFEDAVNKAQSLGNVAVVMLETPDNPTNNLLDIAACRAYLDKVCAEQAEKPVLAVDNTMLGPIWQKPLDHGADLCMYSLTKYVGGHSDLVGGSVSGSKALVTKVRRVRNAIGTTMDSNTAWLILRSLETLKVRVQAATEGAKQVVDFLKDHPLITRIDYPGLLSEDSPQYAIYQKQCKGAGSTFSFEVKGGKEKAFSVLNNLKLVKLAVSLGGTESLAQHPAAMTHSGVPKDRRDEIGVTEGLIRISIGIEEPSDLIADLKQALEG
ncbi:cystathionine gamma-synthase family protein [Alteromonas sp. a30]|uniref:cystathionine gamma-synthase family protein n=1 Tax=Alteromonas sp. a30 TaxID=2730917 RepID=UPI0022821C4F|nr:cystathionine gamma-synthase family protein [Alteromonas sp. a30]MCY7295722.1 cystathionine gamma-synthase family protein [Alteromonas sp. a30]